MNEKTISEILPERISGIVGNRKELAEHLGCSVTAISQFINGTALPKYENLVKIAEYYGVSCDYLLGKTDIKKPWMSFPKQTRLTGKAIDSINSLNDKAIKALNDFLESYDKET